MSVSLSFDSLVKNLQARLQQPLPGALAHDIMRAIPISAAIPKFEHRTSPKPGSVLILLYPDAGHIFFPLIQRSEYTGAHSGQVSLPGGKAEGEEDAITTALREGEEEIGIKGSDVTVIGKLSDFFVIPSNFMVVPIVGFAKSKSEFRANPVEVEKIITGNLQDLIHDEAMKTKEIIAAGSYPLLAPHFEMEGQVVWGATAMMLNELRVVIRELLR